MQPFSTYPGSSYVAATLPLAAEVQPTLREDSLVVSILGWEETPDIALTDIHKQHYPSSVK